MNSELNFNSREIKHEHRVNRVRFYIAGAVMFLIFALLAIFLYWRIVPQKILIINELPVPVTEPENIRAGRIVFLKFDYCKYSDIIGKVERNLVGETVSLPLPESVDATKEGCGILETPLLLPYTIAPERFYVHYKVTYQVNPAREEIIEFDTSTFVLLPLDIKSLEDVKASNSAEPKDLLTYFKQLLKDDN